MERKTIAALALLAVAVVAIATGTLVTYVEAKSANSAARPCAARPFVNMSWPFVNIGFKMKNVWKNVVVREVAKDIGPRVVVSDEFKERVVGVLRSDSDTAKLLAEGYNITNVKPVIKAYVGADGTVSFKAVEAIVTLHKSGTGWALVIVNIEQSKVVKIYTYSVIEKG